MGALQVLNASLGRSDYVVNPNLRLRASLRHSFDCHVGCYIIYV